jgi:hypothetical protein
MFRTRRYVTSVLSCLKCANLRRVYLRERSGTTVTFLINIAMAFGVRSLCVILKIHKQVSMIMMTVCPKFGFLHTGITNL